MSSKIEQWADDTGDKAHSLEFHPAEPNRFGALAPNQACQALKHLLACSQPDLVKALMQPAPMADKVVFRRFVPISPDDVDKGVKVEDTIIPFTDYYMPFPVDDSDFENEIKSIGMELKQIAKRTSNHGAS